jgi:2-oxo-4-hydroxy-4-carboxy-5-ureidoimidazoline decarboxylase
MMKGGSNAGLRIDDVNAMDEAGFVRALGGVFEHSPWVAQRAYAQRPFASVAALHAAMVAVMNEASQPEQLALLRAHPELTGKASVSVDLTADSRREQRGAGLDRCTPQQFADLSERNARYRTRFGFPFIIAVKGLDVDAILQALASRVDRAPDAEKAEALRQVARIGRLRLEALLDGS